MGLVMDCEEKFTAIVKGTRRYFSRAQVKKAVLGVSGGIDSTVTALVLAEALGREKVYALYMPLKLKQGDKNLRDALAVTKMSGINFAVFSIGNACSYLAQTVWKPTKLARANLAARTRMAVLYSFANSKKALVAGTSNRSELLLGYFTKHGDSGSDIMPIASLYKTEVVKMAKWLGIPRKIIEKKPSAGLWHGQTDEKELGLKYEKIDKILSGKFDHKKSTPELEKEFGKKAVQRVLLLVKKNEHKRKKPVIIKA